MFEKNRSLEQFLVQEIWKDTLYWELNPPLDDS